MRIVFSLLSILIGTALIFSGYRFARYLIPALGFLAGLSLGGAVISDIGGSVFLGNLLGITIGIIAGLVFAVLAYFFYAIAVVILLGSLGYWLGSATILALGFHPGVLSVLVGLALGIFVGVLAVILNAPRFVLIAVTSMVGAITAVGGVLLIFHKIPLEAYSLSTANIAISNSFLWSLAAIALVVLGFVIQYNTTTSYDFETWGVSDETSAKPSLTHHSAH